MQELHLSWLTEDQGSGLGQDLFELNKEAGEVESTVVMGLIRPAGGVKHP